MRSFICLCVYMCIPPLNILNDRTNLYKTLYVYHRTSARLNDVFKKISPISNANITASQISE
jgi:hypothetical protein